MRLRRPAYLNSRPPGPAEHIPAVRRGKAVRPDILLGRSRESNRCRCPEDRCARGGPFRFLQRRSGGRWGESWPRPAPPAGPAEASWVSRPGRQQYPVLPRRHLGRQHPLAIRRRDPRHSPRQAEWHRNHRFCEGRSSRSCRRRSAARSAAPCGRRPRAPRARSRRATTALAVALVRAAGRNTPSFRRAWRSGRGRRGTRREWPAPCRHE